MGLVPRAGRGVKPLLQAKQRSLRLKGERLAEEGGELHAVQREQADGRRGGAVAAGVDRLAAEELLEVRRDIGPRTHVLRFFLAPDEAGVAAVVIGEFGEAVA